MLNPRVSRRLISQPASRPQKPRKCPYGPRCHTTGPRRGPSKATGPLPASQPHLEAFSATPIRALLLPCFWGRQLGRAVPLMCICSVPACAAAQRHGVVCLQYSESDPGLITGERGGQSGSGGGSTCLDPTHRESMWSQLGWKRISADKRWGIQASATGGNQAAHCAARSELATAAGLRHLLSTVRMEVSTHTTTNRTPSGATYILEPRGPSDLAASTPA